MTGFLIFCAVVGVSVWLLKSFDKVAGRGPKQISDGIDQASRSRAANPEGRIPCPQCAELILPAAKICPFCKSAVERKATSASTTRSE
jgi:hypothetical protein